MFVVDKSLCPDADRKYECVAFAPDLNGLILWLETQDGATTFDHGDCDDCLFARFMQKIPGMSKPDYQSWYGRSRDFFSLEVRAKISVTSPDYTDALSRARKYVAGTP